MLYLFINTVNKNLPSLALFNERGDIFCKSKFFDKQEVLIKNMRLFFSKNKKKYEKINAVIVISGPGSFTSVRAGVVMANSFNFLYQIPVLGAKDELNKLEDVIRKNLKKIKKAKKTSIAKVYYDRPPNITIKK